MPSAFPASGLPPSIRDEDALQAEHIARLHALDWDKVVAAAAPWVAAVRSDPPPFWALESLLREYPMSSSEGLALMRLAEALLRVPDVETAIALTADQFGSAAEGRTQHTQLSTTLVDSAMALARRMLPEAAQTPGGLVQRLGARAVVAATVRAVHLLGRQFVLGEDLDAALTRADTARGGQGQVRYSFDMLGEGARTAADAARHLAHYTAALRTLAARARTDDPLRNDGMSIKLSALHPRHEPLQRSYVFAELLPDLAALARVAADAQLNLTIDAEECERLELSLELLDALAADVAHTHPQWRGLGLAVQAYQTRALATIDAVAEIAATHRLTLMVRLVKGAYWDGEIKRAQELGLADYPVFTHKPYTDSAYLACARALLEHAALIPQFATHNATTIAAVLQMADSSGTRFELQRLHGMGEGIYRELAQTRPDAPLRIYAPVGEQRDLLAYLVRRLLENGANSSFVNGLADVRVPVHRLLRSPLRRFAAPGVTLPRGLYGTARVNALGIDVTDARARAPLMSALAETRVHAVPEFAADEVARAMTQLHAAWPAWEATSLHTRVAVLRAAGDALEQQFPRFVALLVLEGGKTLADAVAEVRETIDYCRYYAAEAQRVLAPHELPGPTGERNTLRLRGRGVFACISPWNFPLAIFAGQVLAALVTGNAVAAKPAEQTPGIAHAFVELLYDCGLPRAALTLLHGSGEVVGAAIVANAHTAGVCFTGSTTVAKHIQRALAAKDGAIVPLIAETGGLNAMVVDSTALLEQVVDAVVQSAFRSAGQRCSALRLLCVQDDIAAPLLGMLAGAMQQLRVGDAGDPAVDVGPIIDAAALATLHRQVEALATHARLIARTPMAAALAATHLAPVAFQIDAVARVREEVFGPVLHVVTWQGQLAPLLERIDALGYGLTFGLQSRIDARIPEVAARVRAGNLYVNRNIVGAVVGVQPFGGQGLSGTGPKAGGPHYLPRFCAEQTITVNTAAAGGNAALLASTHDDADGD